MHKRYVSTILFCRAYSDMKKNAAYRNNVLERFIERFIATDVIELPNVSFWSEQNTFQFKNSST